MWRVDRKAIPNPPTQGLAFMVHAAWCLIISQPRLCRLCGSHQPQGIEGPVVVVLASLSMAEPTRTPTFSRQFSPAFSTGHVVTYTFHLIMHSRRSVRRFLVGMAVYTPYRRQEFCDRLGLV